MSSRRNETSPEVVAGYVDPRSGVKCGWANGYRDCEVPDCGFPSERCICVQREHVRDEDLADAAEGELV